MLPKTNYPYFYFLTFALLWLCHINEKLITPAFTRFTLFKLHHSMAILITVFRSLCCYWLPKIKENFSKAYHITRISTQNVDKSITVIRSIFSPEKLFNFSGVDGYSDELYVELSVS